MHQKLIRMYRHVADTFFQRVQEVLAFLVSVGNYAHINADEHESKAFSYTFTKCIYMHTYTDNIHIHILIMRHILECIVFIKLSFVYATLRY